MFEEMSLVVGSFYTRINLKWNEIFSWKREYLFRIYSKKLTLNYFCHWDPFYEARYTRDGEVVVSSSVDVSFVLYLISRYTDAIFRYHITQSG